MLGAANNAFFGVPARVPVRPRRWAAGKARTTLLASLLILALLLCHGAMGGFHQLAPHLAADAQASGPGAATHGQTHGHADHASASLEAGPEGERQAGHAEGHPAPYFPPPGFYLAALLVVLLAWIFKPASLGAAPFPGLASWAVRRPPPAAFLPGRSPTASSLQVFRL